LFLIANCNLETTIGRYSNYQPDFSAMVDRESFGVKADIFWPKIWLFQVGESSRPGGRSRIYLNSPSS
jgi:hypothetical protein